MITWFIFPFLLNLNYTNASKAEFNLIRDLLTTYDPLVRPVIDINDKITVNLSVTLSQLIDVDEKNQVIVMNAMMSYWWIDYGMTWNASNYDGVDDIAFASDLLWTPDIIVYNSVDGAFNTIYPVNKIVYNTGLVNWLPPAIIKFSCKIDIRWYPFDEQVCFIKFGSWSYDESKLDLRPSFEYIDMSEFMDSGEWLIQRTQVVRSERFYECCPDPYIDMKFYIYMQRRSLYYILNLILPCILIMSMTVVGFALPSDSGEKISVQITVCLAITVFLMIVSNMTPSTSEAVPLISVFFSFCMFTVCVAVAFTVIVLNIHHTSHEEMGRWNRKLLIEWLPWCLFMSKPETQKPDEDIQDKKSVDNRVTSVMTKMIENSSALGLDTGTTASMVLMHAIHHEMRVINARTTEDAHEHGVRMDWIYAAMVIDRLCLVSLTVITALFSCFILLTAPSLNS